MCMVSKDCQHGYLKLLNAETGDTEFKKYISFFCPDCGIRIPENP